MARRASSAAGNSMWTLHLVTGVPLLPPVISPEITDFYFSRQVLRCGYGRSCEWPVIGIFTVPSERKFNTTEEHRFPVKVRD